MSIRSVAASFGLFVALSGGGLVLSDNWPKEPVPRDLTIANTWSPPQFKAPLSIETDLPQLARPTAVSTLPREPMPQIQVSVLDDVLPTAEPLSPIWAREIESGETLDSVLEEAGLSTTERAEVALALETEYDLRRLRPGHSVTVVFTTDGSLRSIALSVENGVRIEAIFGEELATQVVTPDPDIMTFAGKTVIESSIFAALEEADIPARFAVDLAQMLGGTIDFRRELTGGEILKLLWREARIGEDRIGSPKLTFASLEIGGTHYEIVWPENGSGQATIFIDGTILRVFAQPVEGARLSSVFGRRKHPVYGNVRMHTGVDFAAPRGTPVRATAPGRVSFLGWRGGYGRVVEIAHGSDTMTRYAHLSAVPKNIQQGQRVAAGDVIGRVGATGTATGPNLHYEVRVDGRPTDPLSDERLAETDGRAADDSAALSRLAEARARLSENLGYKLTPIASERL